MDYAHKLADYLMLAAGVSIIVMVILCGMQLPRTRSEWLDYALKAWCVGVSLTIAFALIGTALT